MISLTGTALLCAIGFSQTTDPVTGDTGEAEPVIPTQSWHGRAYEWVLPAFEDISVHDPSLVVADGKFYVFGSHLSAAKTEDFMSWERVADLVTSANPLFEDVTQDLKETFTWAQTSTLWAADVIQLGDGKFYFYYNACKGDSPRSAMGVAVAESVEGPYVDNGIILKSGMWGQVSEDGVTIYDAVIHPNVVDPDTFFDKDGNLWMIYGSYSGGIFILEMNKETGLPLEGQGYGKHLMGGNHQRIEAPNVLYSPHTGYYYMFITYGGLAANGGYNMRVARSEMPDGPYLDSEGNDMINVIGPTAFNDAAIAPFAAKLMGNYLYSPTNNTLGYVSPGHNTTYYDVETGQYFIIFHTRFPYKGEFHQVRVHEMFFNENGWPVVAPLRYAPRLDLLTLAEAVAAEETPETGIGTEGSGGTGDGVVTPPTDETLPGEDPGNGEEPIDEPEETPVPLVYYGDPIAAGDIPGEYQFINHGKEITYVIKRSQGLYLYADGTLRTGSLEGTWRMYDLEVIPVVEEAPVTGETGVVENPTEGTPPADGTTDPETDPAEEETLPVENPMMKNLITLEIETLGTFKGVASMQWNEFLDAFTVTFTAMSENGESIWGVRWADLPVAE